MSKRILTRNALSGIVQVLVTGVVTFELYRFLNRNLSVSEIGTWSVVLASAAAGRLIDLGLGGGVVKFVAHHMGDNARSKASATIQMALVGMVVLFGVASVLLFPILNSGLALLIGDGSSLIQARALLPYALGTLILGSLSGVTLSAIDGCQRMDMRAFVGIAGSTVQLLSAYWLVPRLGLQGLAVGQVIQSLAVFTLGIVFLRRLIGPDLYEFRAWHKATLVQLIRYGSGFQAAAFGQLLFEPAVKALITRYSGLEFTGYYEMANRLIMQIRSILVSAYQSLVPYVAGTLKSEDEIRTIYVASYRLLFFVAALGFGLVGVLLPFLLQIWLGRFVSKFLVIGELCLLGWALNTPNTSAYFMFLGLGKLRWPVISHTVIGFLAAGLGTLFGVYFGGFGVLSAVMVALVLGSHIVSYAFHVRYQIPLRWLIPSESRVLSLFALSGSFLVACSALAKGTGFFSTTSCVAIALLIVLIYLGLRNPNLVTILKLIQVLRRRRGGTAATTV